MDVKREKVHLAVMFRIVKMNEHPCTLLSPYLAVIVGPHLAKQLHFRKHRSALLTEFYN